MSVLILNTFLTIITIHMIIRIVSGLLIAVFFLGCTASSGEQSTTEPLTIFLVRHAEKVDQTEGSGLTSEGAQWAEQLAEAAESAKIKHIHSTDYRRTLETAAPAAALLGVEPEIYDPNELIELATRIKDMKGKHLVVGHSNTTAKMVDLLGGDASVATANSEAYGYIYIVEIDKNGTVKTTDKALQDFLLELLIITTR